MNVIVMMMLTNAHNHCHEQDDDDHRQLSTSSSLSHSSWKVPNRCSKGTPLIKSDGPLHCTALWSFLHCTALYCNCKLHSTALWLWSVCVRERHKLSINLLLTGPTRALSSSWESSFTHQQSHMEQMYLVACVLKQMQIHCKLTNQNMQSTKYSIIPWRADKRCQILTFKH